MADISCWSKRTHPARGWTAAYICTNCVYTIPAPLFRVSRPSLLTKAGDVELNPGLTTHTKKHTPVIWICDKQINKKQTLIRCNTHTKHTGFITHIQQQQYKPDWRCTIHTATQNVTTTPSTDNTTPHHKQTTTHPLTNNNQPKDKNIAILQINKNGIRNEIEGPKT